MRHRQLTSTVGSEDSPGPRPAVALRRAPRWWATPRPWFLAVVLLIVRPCSGIERQYAWENDPPLVRPGTEVVFSPRLTPFWLKLLDRDEVDLKRQVAQTLAEAYRRGMRDLEDVVPRLVAELQVPGQHRTVQLELAHTLVTIDASPSAPALAALLEGGDLDLALVIEPALARWRYPPMRAVWLSRLQDATTPQHQLVLAIRGLEAFEAAEAVPRLLEIATDPRAAPDLRLRSASALARIQPRDLESPATVLARDESSAGRLARLVAATLVSHHQGSAAEKLLLRLAVDPEPTTAALALERLEQLDPNLVAPLNDRVVRSPDPKVRRLSTAILRGQATPDAVHLLRQLLDDVHPDVRRSAADALVGLAPQQPLAQSVRAAAMRALTEAGPLGLEQAALVVGALDHEPAADRLLQLLDHPQPAVNISAAWALRRLAVPATAAPILERIRRETEKTQELGRKLSKLTPDEIAATQLPYYAPLYEQLGHLIEALGEMRYEPCLTLLEKYQFLPKPRVRGLNEPPSIEVNEQPTARTAAYWALGHFHAGKPDPKIVKLCLERLRDVTLDNPEILTVRQMAAVALARMRAESALEYIKRFAIGAGAYTDLAATCRWAQEQMSGQPAAPLEPEVINQINWQIEPLDY